MRRARTRDCSKRTSRGRDVLPAAIFLLNHRFARLGRSVVKVVEPPLPESLLRTTSCSRDDSTARPTWAHGARPGLLFGLTTNRAIFFNKK